MDLGIIKGREITSNRDGLDNKIMMQVEMLDGEVRTIELMCNANEDFNPASGCRIFVVEYDEGYQLGIAATDDLNPESEPGEKELYSTDNPVTQKLAKIKLNKDGEIELNGNMDNVVRWSDLNTQLQLLVANINALFATKLDGGGTAGSLILDISGSKVDEVKTL